MWWMKDINVSRMFSERIRISHRTEAFKKNLSLETIYGAANAQIDFRDESKERWVVSSEFSHCARDIPRLQWMIKSMAAAKCTVGFTAKTPCWIYMQRKIHCGTVSSTLNPTIYCHIVWRLLSIFNDFRCHDLCSVITLICLFSR